MTCDSMLVRRPSFAGACSVTATGASFATVEGCGGGLRATGVFASSRFLGCSSSMPRSAGVTLLIPDLVDRIDGAGDASRGGVAPCGFGTENRVARCEKNEPIPQVPAAGFSGTGGGGG